MFRGASVSHVELRHFYYERGVKRSLLPFSLSLFLKIATVTSGATKLRRVVSIQYGYISVVSPRRPYIPLNPLLRRRGTAREIRQDDGHPLNSPGKLRGGHGRLPEDTESTSDEMKFWSARSPALPRL